MKDKKGIDPMHLNITQKALAALGLGTLIIIIMVIVLPHGNAIVNNNVVPSPTMNINSPANTSINLIEGPGPLAELSQYNHDFVNLIKNKK